MNFSKFDMVLIFSMSLAIVLMSFMFPALGMTEEGDKVNESDIPEFNISSDRWDIVGDFPEDPGTPSTGRIIWNESEGAESDNQRWLHGDTSLGAEHTVINFGSADNPDAEVRLTSWNDDQSNFTNQTITGEGQEFTLESVNEIGGSLTVNFNYTVEYEVAVYENTSGNFHVEVDYLITEQPQDEAWYERVPLLGGLFSAGADLAGIVGWIGSILYWFVASTFEIALTLVTILFDVMVYGISMLQWLTGTYSSIISGAGGFAQVLVAMPPVLLFVEFAKIGMIGISLLPFT